MSDHCSGPRGIAGPSGDICDVFPYLAPPNAAAPISLQEVLP